MISFNTIIGNFQDITKDERVIEIPNAEKVIFIIDNVALDISINDNQHYMKYNNWDGVIEYLADPAGKVGQQYITKLYVKSNINTALDSNGMIRIWAKI